MATNLKEYLLLFRGGANPEDMTPEQMQTTMGNWMAWMKDLKKNKQLIMGHPLKDDGKVFSGPKGKTAVALTETPDTVGGYMIFKAGNLTEANKIARGCPIFNNGGTVELRAIDPCE